MTVDQTIVLKVQSGERCQLPVKPRKKDYRLLITEQGGRKKKKNRTGGDRGLNFFSKQKKKKNHPKASQGKRRGKGALTSHN